MLRGPHAGLQFAALRIYAALTERVGYFAMQRFSWLLGDLLGNQASAVIRVGGGGAELRIYLSDGYWTKLLWNREYEPNVGEILARSLEPGTAFVDCGANNSKKTHKITICHATGSSSTPFKTITVDNNSTYEGHGAHSGDVIPAPGDGCSPPPARGGNGGGGGHGRIKICHATGSITNPYVEIEVGANGLNGHGGHTGDIIPAPAGGCPGGDTPGEDQYKPGKGCGDKNHVHFKEGECKEKKEKKEK